MKKSDPFWGYTPQLNQIIPSCEELFEKYQIFDKKRRPINYKNLILINKRALLWLQHAATYAHAIFTAILYFTSEEDRLYYQKTLDELSGVIKDIRENNLELKKEGGLNLTQKIQTAANAVAHAGNMLNNCVLRFPENLRRAILETRDLCDEAIRQPGAHKS